MRDKTFDIAKAIAIMLVILGHSIATSEYKILVNLVFLANLSVFFVSSGYFYRPNKTMKQIVLRGINTLFVPYLIGTVVFFVLYTARHFRELNHVPDYLMAITVGNAATNVTLPGNIHVAYSAGVFWFLPMMFVANIIFHLIMRLPNDVYRGAGVLVMTVLGMVIARIYFWPWTFQSALQVQVYYFMGYLLSKHVRFIRQPVWWFVVLELFLVAIVTKSGMYLLSAGIAPNIVLSTIGAAASALVLLQISNRLSMSQHLRRTSKFLAYLGQISIMIFIVHAFDNGMIVSAVLRQLTSHLHQSSSLLLGMIAFAIIRFIIDTTLAYLLVSTKITNKLFVDRDFPIRIGGRQ